MNTSLTGSGRCGSTRQHYLCRIYAALVFLCFSICILYDIMRFGNQKMHIYAWYTYRVYSKGYKSAEQRENRISGAEPGYACGRERAGSAPGMIDERTTDE